ncbi:MAG: hypothetical protein SWY16_02395 [Cyanobacteriota bacterium]|nr:hypothetical protein [Cyanobacteriota bacterium]
MPLVQLLPDAIPEMLVSVARTKCLTIADRYGLMAATLDESLSEEERLATNRLLMAVRRGRVKVVDRISAVWERN